jgi:hypothetical protein
MIVVSFLMIWKRKEIKKTRKRRKTKRRKTKRKRAINRKRARRLVTILHLSLIMIHILIRIMIEVKDKGDHLLQQGVMTSSMTEVEMAKGVVAAGLWKGKAMGIETCLLMEGNMVREEIGAGRVKGEIVITTAEIIVPGLVTAGEETAEVEMVATSLEKAVVAKRGVAKIVADPVTEEVEITLEIIVEDNDLLNYCFVCFEEHNTTTAMFYEIPFFTLL